MKSAVAIFLVLVFASLCLFGCSNIPDEPATTKLENFSYVNPYGETVAAPDNLDELEGQTYPVQYVETVNKIECVLSSYYVYGNTVAEIVSIELDDDGFSVNADGRADVKITAIGSRKNNMKIGYTAYDKDGNIVRDTYILAKLDDVKEGDIVEKRRFDFPRETVKIVFHDYVEPED